MINRARKLIVGLAVTVGAVLAGASVAWACTNHATLNLSQVSGAAGSEVAVSGSSFATTGAPITLHLNSATGAALGALAVATPDQTGALAPVTVRIPANAGAGYYAISATQAGENGQSSAVTYLVTGPAVARTAPISTGGSGPGAGILALLSATGVAGLGLFFFGANAAIRHRRGRASAPGLLNR